MSNLRQLLLGMNLYVDNNNNVYPGAASRNTYGFRVDDRIYWRLISTCNPVEKSPIVVYTASANSNLFRCPVDKDDRDRITIADGYGPYIYSYSMNSYGLGNNNQNLGMTSINDGSWHPF